MTPLTSIAPAPRSGIRRHNSHAAWREVGGRRIYFRSAWEANYARYLEWLRGLGEIREWDHEPHTFWFEAIRRGVRSYLPDFRVVERDGRVRWHEVKGYMDARSRTTLRRMGKYHPDEVVVLVDAKQYGALKRQCAGIVKGWER